MPVLKHAAPDANAMRHMPFFFFAFTLDMTQHISCLRMRAADMPLPREDAIRC